MTVYKDIDFNKPLTSEQKEMLRKLADAPVMPDEECPALTAEELQEMYRVSKKKNINLRFSKSKKIASGFN